MVLSTIARLWKGQLYGIQLGLHWRDDFRRALLLSIHFYQYLPVLVSAALILVLDYTDDIQTHQSVLGNQP